MQEKWSDSGLPFMKMHGLGNDFVVIDSRGHSAVTTPQLALAIGDRHRGVGFDQLAEIRDSDDCDIQLDFWNADGTVAQACGNATRCVARHVMHQNQTSVLRIRTLRGVLHARICSDGAVSVNMGPPHLDWHDIPLSDDVDLLHLPVEGDASAVGMGNPHLVFFVSDADEVDVAGIGRKHEHHPLFPEGTNVEFVQIRSRGDIRMRVWERGTGITLACGSGACAAVVAAARRGLTDRHVKMQLDGGWLTLDWQDDGVWMTGPTAHVFSAYLTTEFLDQLA